MKRQCRVCRVFFCFLALFIVLSLSSSLQAGESATASSMREVDDYILLAIAKYGANHVLVVYDLDHTLISTPNDLGSAPWYDWQVELLKTPERESEQIAADFPELLQINGKILESVGVRLTDNENPPLTHAFHLLNIAQIILTSRGPKYRDFTEASLHKFGLNFGDGFAPESCNLNGEWLPGQGDFKGDLTNDEISAYKLDKPRFVSFERGLFLSEGQNKGAILRILFAKCDLYKTYKAIVFIDDAKKHVERVQEAFTSEAFKKLEKPVDVTTVLFTADYARFKKFNESDKHTAVQEYESWKTGR